MRIRSITLGIAGLDQVPAAAAAAREARERLEGAGLTVQTTRVALPPLVAGVPSGLPALGVEAEGRIVAAGFDYVSLGPIESPALLQAVPELIGATQRVFCSIAIATAQGGVLLESCTRAAEAMHRTALVSPDGFGNLRFAALANVPPGAPFFPAAYHDAGAPALALAIEAADLALEAAQASAGDRALFVRMFRSAIERESARMDAALAGIDRRHSLGLLGYDWSPAPHPDEHRSIGAAIEALSGVPFGGWGTLAAVRLVTSAIRAADVRRTGFSGVMLPVLEDATLAQRCREGRFTVRDLLAFSAVCGTGLDTIPLPGDTPAAQLAGVLAEVATLAAALRKPLTARLMPLPGRVAGDETSFVFDYFVNTRVMHL